MVMFHSYIKLPEGNHHGSSFYAILWKKLHQFLDGISHSNTLWLFNIAMENGPFIDVFFKIYLFKMAIFHGHVK